VPIDGSDITELVTGSPLVCPDFLAAVSVESETTVHLYQIDAFRGFHASGQLSDILQSNNFSYLK
jgi:hypothetical protein